MRTSCYRAVVRIRPLLLVLLCISAGLSARPAAAIGVVTADQPVIDAGAEVVVRATGFRGEEFITSWASSAGGAVWRTATGHADRAGNVSLVIKTKRFWEPGWWAITLQGANSDRRAIGQFEIVQAPPDGALELDRPVARAGDEINFRGDGFAREGVAAWATRPDGGAIKVEDMPDDAEGEIRFSFEVPGSAQPGTWYMTAYGTESDRLLVVSFTVTP